MVVSEKDRRNWERQVAALELEDSEDEGSPDFRVEAIESVNRRRILNGRPALETEGEFHHRARSLGLLVDALQVDECWAESRLRWLPV